MTDNKLWDIIIEPNMNVSLVPAESGRVRGIRISYITEDGVLIEVEEKGTNNIGTNFKKARQKMIDNVRATMVSKVA